MHAHCPTSVMFEVFVQDSVTNDHDIKVYDENNDDVVIDAENVWRWRWWWPCRFFRESRSNLQLSTIRVTIPWRKWWASFCHFMPAHKSQFVWEFLYHKPFSRWKVLSFFVHDFKIVQSNLEKRVLCFVVLETIMIFHFLYKYFISAGK